MADYLTRTLSRTINQLLLLFGGIFLLAFLLCTVASQIRGAGESVFGRGYYYFVAPGVVCHETGHALGCLLTGTKIIHYEPFRPHGRQLGHVIYQRHNGNLLWQITEFLIAFGPIWFGCLMINLLTRCFGKHAKHLSFETCFPGDLFPSSRSYWLGTIKAAGRMLVDVVRLWRWKSSLDIVYLYLVFCIASEMGLSETDFAGLGTGMLLICAFFLVLNIVPAIGMKVSGWTFRMCKYLFVVHSIMLFVLIIDILFVLLFVWPIRFFFR